MGTPPPTRCVSQLPLFDHQHPQREFTMTLSKAVQCVVLALVCLAACSDTTEPNECAGNVELNVALGLAPLFRWEPQCSLSTLVVLNDVQQVMWNIRAPTGENTLESRIRYGEVPSGAVEEAPAIALQAGAAYTVRVLRLERQQDELFVVPAAEKVFQP